MKRRFTRQRQGVYDVLIHRHDHPTAEEIFSEVRIQQPGISLGTVYRNLDLLTREGVIKTLSSPGNPRRYDGKVYDHPHARCLSCGALIDIPDDRSISVGAFSFPGFTVTGLSIEVRGYCSRCRSCNEGDPKESDQHDI
ncbi:transcriptional repressor [bacterium]|nr:transcriptional repressor [candidate division CSSED10-310 bacterium]